MDSIQWYPGHMTKAKREMEESRKLIDVVLELVDARLPFSSRNPDIDALGRQKTRLILLNKADLADERKTRAWEKWFRGQGYPTVTLDSRSGKGMKAVQQAIRDACQEKIERDRRRGIQNRPIRAMVAGIPNVGKSTFINSFARKACTKTGNQPGVTKGNQWIRLNRSVELLDTPGILWPKLEDQEAARRLALVGTVNDEVLDRTQLAAEGIRFLQEAYPGALSARYPGAESGDPADVLDSVAKQRGALKQGGEPDWEKAARLFLDDLRAGRLGRITLESPPPEPED